MNHDRIFIWRKQNLRLHGNENERQYMHRDSGFLLHSLLNHLPSILARDKRTLRVSLKNITNWHFFSLSSNCCNIIEITLREHRNSWYIFCVVMHSYIKKYFLTLLQFSCTYLRIYYVLNHNSVLNVYISWLK